MSGVYKQLISNLRRPGKEAGKQVVMPTNIPTVNLEAVVIYLQLLARYEKDEILELYELAQA